MLNLGTAVASIRLDTSGLNQSFSGIKKQFSELEKSTKGFQEVGKNLGNVGSSLTRNLTLPLAGLGAGIFKVGSDFEKSMAEVKAITSATGQDFQDLTNKAREMGKNTLFGAKDVGQAMKYMGLAGWNTRQIMAGLPSVLNLATAAGMDLGRASDIVTDGLTAFGLGAEDAERFTDVLAQTMRRSNTDVNQLGEAFKYVGSLAGALNFSIEDVSLALGLMANQGIKSSQAGTVLRGVFTRLLKPTDEIKRAMQDLNVSLFDQDGSARALKDIMIDLRKAFTGLTDEQKSTYAAMLGGQRAVSGLLAIVNSTEEDFNKLADAMKDAKGANQEMADTMKDTSEGSFQLMMGRIEELAITFFEKLKPVFDGLTGTIGNLADLLSKMDPNLVSFIAILGTIGVVAGPLIWIIGNLVTVFSSLFSLVSVLVTPGGLWALLAVVSALGVAWLAWTFKDDIIKFFKDLVENNPQLIEQLKEMGVALWELVKTIGISLWETLKNLLEILKEIWEKTEPLRKIMLELAIRVFPLLIGILTAFFRWLNSIIKVAGDFWNWLVWLRQESTKLGERLNSYILKPLKDIYYWFGWAKDRAWEFSNNVREAINRIGRISLPKIPWIGGGLKIPGFAQGGVFKSPQIGVFGESGAEAVVPLEKNTEWINKVSKLFLNELLPLFTNVGMDMANTFADILIARLSNNNLMQYQPNNAPTTPGTIIIENINVRDDYDIQKIIDGLNNYNVDLLRAKGERNPSE